MKWMKWDMDMPCRPCHTVTIKTTCETTNDNEFQHRKDTQQKRLSIWFDMICFCFHPVVGLGYLNQFQYRAGTILHKKILLYLSATAWKLVIFLWWNPESNAGKPRRNQSQWLRNTAVHDMQSMKPKLRNPITGNEEWRQNNPRILGSCEVGKLENPNCGRARELRQGCEVDPRQLQKRLRDRQSHHEIFEVTMCSTPFHSLLSVHVKGDPNISL